MKTRIITAVIGLAVLAVVLAFFDTILFDLVLAAICLLGIHEVFTAMGFGKKQWYLYAAAVPFTMLLMLSSSGAARAALLAVGFLTVLFYNVVLITHDMHLMLEYTPRAIVFHDGQVIADTSAEEVLNSPEIVETAHLKETSLYHLAKNCGIASSRMTTEGKSYSMPVADNSTKEGRAQNRRVEIYITANKAMIEKAENGTL